MVPGPIREHDSCGIAPGVPGAASIRVQHVMSRLTGGRDAATTRGARSCWLCSLPLVMSMVAVALLLGRSASESGRLCHRDGGPEGGDRRRKVLMLAILPRSAAPAQNGVDSRSGILQTPKELVESPFPLRNQTWKETFCSWTRKNSYPFSVVDTSTDTLLGILPSNGGHHDCVIIPTMVEQMKHTRPARFDRARLTGRSLTAWDGCRLPCDLERPGL